jgi:hypothetical protein
VTLSAQLAGRLAWSCWGITIALTALSILLCAATIPNLHPGRPDLWLFVAFLVLAATSFATVGALICARQPRHPIGWMFCATGVIIVLLLASGAFADYTLLTKPGALPGGAVAAWLNVVLPWPLEYLSGPLLLLLFPTGHLLSRRWRPVLWFATSGLALVVLGSALQPGRVSEAWPSASNPFGVPLPGLLERARQIGLLAIAVSSLASIVSLLRRLRRARGAERQQIKWVAYVAALIGVGIGGSFFLDPLGDVADLAFMLGILALALFPGAVGLAILRHRLYDIDRIINRTLVYALLSGSLGLVYIASVVLFQRILEPLISGNDLAIAGSTLAVAALFRPTRRRVQAVVDRRFYRDKYDAATTIDAFSTRLRAAIDVDTLEAELCSVARQSMQPASVSLWIRSMSPVRPEPAAIE